MKKKLVALLLCGALAMSITACGTKETGKNSDKKTETTAPEPAKEKKDEKPQSGKVDKVNLDNADGTLVYSKHEVSQDWEGKPAIIVYFDYTNKKDESSYAQMTFYPQVFQNGVECEMAISTEDNEALSNASKEIQKGTTLGIAYIYTLQDTENPVTLKVTDQSEEHILDGYYQEQELALK